MNIIQRPSPNRAIGRQGFTPDFIVCHTTGGSFTSAVNTVLNPANQVSYHFIISRLGEIVQCVNIADTAWANGTTNSGDNRDNRHSTVAEIVQRRVNANLYTVSIGFADMPSGNPSPQQLDAGVWLIRHIAAEVRRIYGYNMRLGRERIIGHNEITPIRKPGCPGRGFPFDEIIMDVHMPQANEVKAPPPAPSPDRPFADVPPGHWSEEAFSKMHKLGLISGLGDGTVGFGQPMETERIVQLMWNVVKRFE